ncbi:unnamed protein product [Rhodiola kirilowii]
MDDVDRLFECFKCGIIPPKSALRERKRSKREPRHHDPSGQSESPASVSVERRRKNVKGAELSSDKIISKSTVANKINSGKQFSPIVFYGSPRGVPPKRQSRLLRLLHEIRSDLSDHAKLESSREVWATFPRQDEAIKSTKEHQNVCIFSYQDHFSGQRRFLVSSYKEFWRRYKQIKANHRHHYEVIQEGLPCHLYFDLEFNNKDNHDKNGDEMVDILIKEVLDALRDKYSIHGCDDWIVELDSSTADKFSRHLIVRVPGAAFKDNIHAGAFVAEICSRINNAKDSEDSLQKLFICKDSTSSGTVRQLFVDSAVYSRNRCFRLPLSSKAGKDSVLLPTVRFKCKDMCEEDMFMASLICNMDRDCKTLLVCKMDANCIKTLQFDTEVNQKINFTSDLQERKLNAFNRDISSTCYMRKSPFPALDDYMVSIATIGNVSGKIQSWYLFSEYGLMVYSMSRNRYCERIGRQHKSNHIMYVVDLRRATYYQNCHDPDCRGYRSPMRVIPYEVFPDAAMFFDSVEPGKESMNNTESQLNEISEEHGSLQQDSSIIDSCKKDGWWLEAIKVAEDIENTQRMLELNTMEEQESKDGDDDDEEWWTEVERVAMQAKLI